ncbi:MAG TPA: class I tRNA ligase family protein, partial [Deferrimonas sp.]
TVEGQKMSKSLGNVIDPYEMVEKYGADAFRYFLLREVPFGKDGDFSRKALVDRINSDLANNLGNLLNRSLNMLAKYFGSVVPSPSAPELSDEALLGAGREILPAADAAMEEVEFHKVLAAVLTLSDAANRYIDTNAPWALAKDPARKNRLGTVLYHALEAARVSVLLMSPFIPTAAQRMWEALGCDGRVEKATLSEAGRWGGLRVGATLPRSVIAFPRIED